LVWHEVHAIIQSNLDGFWVVFIQQLDSKLNNSKSQNVLVWLTSNYQVRFIFTRTFV